jgi:hypothetical protein
VQQPCSNADVLSESCFHSPHGLVSHARQEVRVGIQSHGYGCVPQKLLDEFRVGALRKQQGSAGVSEVVEADVRQPGARVRISYPRSTSSGSQGRASPCSVLLFRRAKVFLDAAGLPVR